MIKKLLTKKNKVDDQSVQTWLNIVSESCEDLSAPAAPANGNATSVEPVNWDFSQALFMAVTIVTTIGKMELPKQTTRKIPFLIN